MAALSSNKPSPYVVVAGVDFSPFSQEAVREALRHAVSQPDGELHLVHVLREGEGGVTRSVRIKGQERLLEELPKHLRSFAFEAVRSLGGQVPSSRLGVHVRIGSPAVAIVQLCVDLGANLVVVGTHGGGKLENIVLGSVAQDLVRLARCPLLIARATDYDSLPASERALPPCAACIDARQASAGADWWCAVHGRAHVATHVYSSAHSVNWGSHDAEASVTGIDM